MKRRYAEPMSEAELAEIVDADIDFSDLPELDERFWREAKLVRPDRTAPEGGPVHRKDALESDHHPT